MLPDVVYIKSPDGVIVRFADRKALRNWLQDGRIPVERDAQGNLVSQALWLDSDNVWKSLNILLEKLGISLDPSVGVDPRIAAFPDANDDYFRKSFGPAAQRYSTTGEFGAMDVPQQDSEPRTGKTTDEMAAFDAAPEPAPEPVPEPVPATAGELSFAPTPEPASEPATEPAPEPAPEPDVNAGAVAGIRFETTPASVSPVLSVRRKPAVEDVADEDEDEDPEMIRAARGNTKALRVLIAVLVLTILGASAWLAWPYLSTMGLFRGPAVAVQGDDGSGVVEKDAGGTTGATTDNGMKSDRDVVGDQGSAVADAAAGGVQGDSGATADARGADVPAGDVIVKADAGNVPAEKLQAPVPPSRPAEQSPRPLETTPVAVPVPEPAVKKPAPELVVKKADLPAPAPVVKKVKQPAPAPVLKKAPQPAPYVDTPVAAGDFNGHMKAGDKALSRDPEVALAHYSLAHQLKPGNPLPLHKMGEACFKLRRYEEAKSHYERALGLVSSYGPAMIGLARVAKARGIADEARRYYQMYLDVNPSGTQAKEARQYLGIQ